MTTVSARYGVPSPVKLINQPSGLLACPTTRVGVEVELENATHVAEIDKWTYVREGSLHYRGREFVFSAPYFGEDVIVALGNLEEAYKSAPPFLSPDSSLHVHVDVRDLSMVEVLRLISLSFMFEPLLMDTYCQQRVGNVFCQQLGDNQNLFAGVSASIQQMVRGTDHLPVPCRYGNLNILSMQSLGSLEYRGHGPEYKTGPILTWINVLLCLKKQASNTSIHPLKPHLAFKNRASRPAVESVFGEYGSLIYDNTNLTRLLNRGMQDVRTLFAYSSTSRKAFQDRVDSLIEEEIAEAGNL